MNATDQTTAWTPGQRFLFRIAFIFFVLLSIPLSLDYYQTVFSLNWFDLGYRDLTNMGRFSPKFINVDSDSGRWGLASYADYLLLSGVALIGAVIWTLLDKKNSHYRLLYYWLRVIVRYRIAIGMIEFGFVKVFLIQMPEAPLATLHTRFGDITAQKLYWLSVGVVPWYEVTLGFVEVIAGFLLFFRKTTLPGALLTMAASANIVYINFAYDGGVHVYSTYFVILAVFLLIPYVPEYYKLLVKGQDVVPVRYYPSFSKPVNRYFRVGLKAGIIFLFVGVLAYLHVQNRRHQPFIKEPVTAGLADSRGYYEVSEFRVNGSLMPYDPRDSVRRQDAIFELYSTISVKLNKPLKINLSNGVPQKKDVDRTWELTGIAGGRHYYYYEADTVKRTLTLFTKNKPATEGRKQKKKEKKSGPDYVFNYSRPDGQTILLEGFGKRKDSLVIKLRRIPREYAIKR